MQKEEISLFAGSGGGGGGDAGGHIAKDSIFSNATLRVLDLLSEGQVGGLVDGAKSIFFNDVPLQNKNGTYNFDNIWVDGVYGTPHQKVLENYGEVVMPKNVGIEVKQNLPVVVAIDNPNADRIRPVVHLNSLSESDSSGNVDETSVKFRFEVAINNTGDWISLGEHTISGKQNSTYQKAYEFKLPKKDKHGKPPKRWLVKMTRLSKDSDEKYNAKSYFNSVFVVMDSHLNYPNSAIIGIKANAENLGSIPTRSYLIDGMMLPIPSNYNQETNTYEGIWDGTFKYAVTSNPAWILYSLLTNKRWGLGEYISPSQVNKGKLYEIGRYCDEEVDDGFGQKEKRFTINTQIRDRSEAYRLIGDICAAFRGMTFWANGMADFMCDKPTDPSMVYSPSNVINGTFTYSSSGKNERHSVCLVTWNDPEQNYKQVVEYIEDYELIKKYGVRQTEFKMFGCTSRGQAIRAGKWILYTETYETNMVSFLVGLDSALVLPGDVVQIQDPVYSGKRLGGRLIEAGKTYAILDKEVELTPSNDSSISIRMPDGTFEERDIIVSFKGNFKRIEWNEPLKELPVANAIWLISEKTLVPQLARVVNIEQGEGKGTYKITAVLHEPSKYDLIEKNIKIESRPTSTVDLYNITPPDHINVEEVNVPLKYGLSESKLVVTWMPTCPSMGYEFSWRFSSKNRDEGEWTTEKVTATSFIINNVQKGTYSFRLKTIGLKETKTDPIEFFYRADGDYITPLDVREFEIIKRPSFLELRWQPVDNAYAYEVRCGDSWDDAEVIISGFKGTSTVHYQDKAGVYKYHVRCVTLDGEYSPNVTTTILDLRAPRTPEDLTAVVHENRIDFFWKRNPEDDINYYELREGQNWSSGVKVAESKVSQMSIPSGSKAHRKFWLKAIALPKIYSDEAGWVEINIEADQSKNIVISHNARQFNWDGNMIGLDVSGDDLTMKPWSFHSEYIKKSGLPEEINAVNSFYSQVSSMSRHVTKDINWERALFDWHSEEARRAWRLGGEGNDTAYENQIALARGLNRNEYDSWSLNSTLDSVAGNKAVKQSHINYEWGRYQKGLRLEDTTGVEWKLGSIRDKGDDFKFSIWYRPTKIEPDTTYGILRIGDDDNVLSVSYSTKQKRFTLSDSSGNEINIDYDIKPEEYYLIAISQNRDKRTFAIGSLNGKIVIENSVIPPMKSLGFLKIGSV